MKVSVACHRKPLHFNQWGQFLRFVTQDGLGWEAGWSWPQDCNLENQPRTLEVMGKLSIFPTLLCVVFLLRVLSALPPAIGDGPSVPNRV